jgi:very-short-patch-repair endonuclease
MPGFNVRLAEYLVDALWADRRLVVEVDGFQFHGHRTRVRA